jgi:two-component system cell cycle sensor histidine kinase/response regulator CckA
LFGLGSPGKCATVNHGTKSGTGICALDKEVHITDQNKTRAELELELEEMHRRVSTLEAEFRKGQTRERILRNSENRYRQVVQESPNPILAVDEEGVIVSWNLGCEKITGFTQEKALGRNFDRFLSGTEHSHLKSVIIHRVFEGQSFSGFELDFRCHDGTTRRTVSRAYPVRDENNNVVECILANTDVTRLKQTEEKLLKTHNELERKVSERTAELLKTNEELLDEIRERKRAEDAVARGEEIFRKYFELGLVGMALTSPDKAWVYVNDRICGMLGYSREELLQTTWPELTHPDDLEGELEQLDQLLVGEINGYELDKRFIRSGGETIYATAHVSCIRRPDGEVEHVIAHYYDITERKRLEEQFRQAQKMEAIGTLAGGIAHDFNNLLHAVMGYADLLLLYKNEADPDFTSLQSIVKAARNGRELTQRMLMFSRKSGSDPRPVDLNREVRQVESILQRTIPRMIDIELLLADDLHTISADPSHMEQLLMNLAVNAKDAMPDGGRFLIETKNVRLNEDYCRIHLEIQPGEYVLLQVSDTGQGMEKDILDRIFEPFYSTKEAGRGTGLGLSAVYGMVKEHRGHIICYSEQGTGTTFKIYFPTHEAEVPVDVAETMETPAFGTETILLVDDEEMLRDLGREALAWAGYTVLTASNGKEALDVFQKEKDDIDLVIVDLIMPEMGGKECIEGLLKIDPDVKVIVASGYSANGPTKKVIDVGAKALIDKPFDTNLLLQSVRKVLDE